MRNEWLGAAILGLVALLGVINPVAAQISPCQAWWAICYTDSQGNRFCGFPGQTSVLCSTSMGTQAPAQMVQVLYRVHIQFVAQTSLSDVSVTLYDQSGTVLGKATSPDGSEVEIDFMTSNPPVTLTASAAGQVGVLTWWQYLVSLSQGKPLGLIVATGSSTINVEGSAGGDFYITVVMF